MKKEFIAAYLLLLSVNSLAAEINIIEKQPDLTKTILILSVTNHERALLSSYLDSNRIPEMSDMDRFRAKQLIKQILEGMAKPNPMLSVKKSD